MLTSMINMQARKPATETDSQHAYARLAGFMYLFVLAFDIAGVVIVSIISGNGNFLDAAHSIASWEPLYRIGLLCGLVGSLATVPLAIGLYVALKPVDGNLAMMALLFRAIESAIGGVLTILGFATLQIYSAANHASAFDAKQLGVLADLNSGVGTDVGAIFFCVGSTIYFYLFLKSAYIPRLLAGWGIFASLWYVASFVLTLIVPHYSGILSLIGALPILVAEVSTGLWLLIRGINTNPRASKPVASYGVAGD